MRSTILQSQQTSQNLRLGAHNDPRRKMPSLRESFHAQSRQWCWRTNNEQHVTCLTLPLFFFCLSLSLSRYQAKSKLRPDQGPSRLHDSETQEMNGCARQMRSIFKRVEGKETVQNQSPLGWRPSQAGWRPSLLGLQAIDSSLVSRSRTPVERPWRRSHWLKPSALGSAAKWSDDSAGEFCSLAKLRCQRALCLNAALCRPQGRHLFTCNRRMIRL